MFTARSVGTAEAHAAYPLVACRYPALGLEEWLDFVHACHFGEMAEQLVGLVDARGSFHALFAYRVIPGALHNRLNILHIATFRLAGDAIYRAFHAALDRLARESDCREVVIEPWAPARTPACPRLAADPDGHGGRILSIAPALERAQTLN